MLFDISAIRIAFVLFFYCVVVLFFGIVNCFVNGTKLGSKAKFPAKNELQSVTIPKMFLKQGTLDRPVSSGKKSSIEARSTIESKETGGRGETRHKFDDRSSYGVSKTPEEDPKGRN